MKKIKTHGEKLALATATVKTLTDPQMARTAGASFSGCLYLTKPTTQPNNCQ